MSAGKEGAVKGHQVSVINCLLLIGCSADEHNVSYKYLPEGGSKGVSKCLPLLGCCIGLQKYAIRKPAPALGFVVQVIKRF